MRRQGHFELLHGAGAKPGDARCLRHVYYAPGWQEVYTASEGLLRRDSVRTWSVTSLGTSVAWEKWLELWSDLGKLKSATGRAGSQGSTKPSSPDQAGAIPGSDTLDQKSL